MYHVETMTSTNFMMWSNDNTFEGIYMSHIQCTSWHSICFPLYTSLFTFISLQTLSIESKQNKMTEGGGARIYNRLSPCLIPITLSILWTRVRNCNCFHVYLSFFYPKGIEKMSKQFFYFDAFRGFNYAEMCPFIKPWTLSTSARTNRLLNI